MAFRSDVLQHPVSDHTKPVLHARHAIRLVAPFVIDEHYLLRQLLMDKESGRDLLIVLDIDFCHLQPTHAAHGSQGAHLSIAILKLARDQPWHRQGVKRTQKLPQECLPTLPPENTSDCSTPAAV